MGGMGGGLCMEGEGQGGTGDVCVYSIVYAMIIYIARSHAHTHTYVQVTESSVNMVHTYKHVYYYFRIYLFFWIAVTRPPPSHSLSFTVAFATANCRPPSTRCRTSYTHVHARTARWMAPTWISAPGKWSWSQMKWTGHRSRRLGRLTTLGWLSTCRRPLMRLLMSRRVTP